MWKVYVGIAAVVLSIVTWKYFDMRSDIKKLKTEVETLRVSKVTLEVDLQTERDNVKLLEKTVADLTKDISVLTKSKDYFRTKYNALKSKSISEQIKDENVRNYLSSDVWNSNDCNNSVEINKWISELKYEDL